MQQHDAAVVVGTEGVERVGKAPVRVDRVAVVAQHDDARSVPRVEEDDEFVHRRRGRAGCVCG